MRSFLPSLMLLVLPASAHAMNWEGKDDWMTEMEPAAVYEQAAPHARPQPDRPCPVGKAELKDNPYEQIPLDRHGCPPDPATAGAEN
jgi:hypothetical protein